MQGLKCHPSRPPVPEERQINHLHAEKLKRRKAKHDKACKIARAEWKPRPATPESTDEEEEEASDAEGHLPGDDGAATGASSPPTYQWDDDEGAPASLGETRTVAESSADPSLEWAERESSVLTAPRLQADPRAAPSGQSSRGGAVPRAQRSGTRKRSMSAGSG